MALDVASLRIAINTGDLAAANRALDKFAAQSENTQRRVVSSTQRIGASARGMATDLRAAFALLGVGAAVRQVTQISDAYANITGRLKLVTSGSAELAEVQGRLFKVAQATATSYQDVASLYAKVSQNAGDLGLTSQQLIGFTKTISESFQVSGASAAEASGALRQLTQALASGVFRGEEFNSVAEQGPRIMKALTDSLGVSRGELRKMAEQGQLTAQLVIGAMQAQSGAIEAEFKNLPRTVGRAMAELRNEFERAVAQTDISPLVASIDDIKASLNDPAMREGIVALSTGMVTIATWAVKGAAAFGEFGQYLGRFAAGMEKDFNEGSTFYKLFVLGTPFGRINNALNANAFAKRDGVIDKIAGATAKAIEETQRLIGTYEELTDASSVQLIPLADTETLLKNEAKAALAAATAQAALGKAREDAAKSAQRERERLIGLVDQLSLESLTDPQRLQAQFEEQVAGLRDALAGGIIDEARFAEIADGLKRNFWDKIAADGVEATKPVTEAFDAFMSTNFGGDFASGFDQASQSIGRFVGGFSELVNQQELYNKAREEAGADPLKLQKAEIKNQRDQLALYGDITGAAKGFFKEGSKGYKTLQAAETTFRAVELALALESFAVKAGLMEAETIAHVAKEGIKATASGITAAVSSMAGLPFPANLAALGATIAAIAALGVAIGGGGSRGAGATNTGTGTVFGDSGALSESIGGSSDALKDAAELQNRISMQMLGSLRNIESGIAQAVNIGVRSPFGGELAAGQRTGSSLDRTAAGSILGGPIGAATFGLSIFDKALAEINRVRNSDFAKTISSVLPVIGGLIRSVFSPSVFGTKRTVTGFGLSAGPQSFGSIAADGLNLQEFADIRTKRKSFGVTTSDKTRRVFTDAGDEITNEFTNIFRSIGGSILDAGDILGKNLTDALNAVIVDIGAVNLQGLTGEALSERLSAVISAEADQIAQAVMPQLQAFQQVGEGYYQTLIRVATGVDVAESATKALGLAAIDYTAIIQKQGDVAVEIIRQSFLAVEQTQAVAGGVYEIVDAFSGTSDEIVDLIRQLRDLQDSLVATGKSGADLTTFMIRGAGGADRLADGLDTFFDDFLTDQERAAELTRRASRDFAQLGVSLPDSVAAYRALIDSVDTSTEAGQGLYGALIALAPEFAELQDSIEQASSGVNALVKSLRDLADEANKNIIQAQNPNQSLDRMRREFASTAALAGLGNREAAEALPSLGKALIEASRIGAASRQQFVRDLSLVSGGATNAADVLERTPAFASGGFHSGGLRIVGENGPELEYTPPSRIFNASQTAGMLDMSQVRNELAGLRKDLTDGLYAVAKNTRKTYEKLNDWDGDGLPAEREAA